MSTTPALIVTAPLVGPENDLPGAGPGGPVDPGFGVGRPRPGRPDNTLPPLIGIWPPRPIIWPPVPPIHVDIDPDVGISLPIVLPGSPDQTLPPVDVEADRPTNPIVLPPLPESGVMVALILPLPGMPKAGSPPGTQAALLWYGPGTIPSVVYLPPPGTPK